MNTTMTQIINIAEVLRTAINRINQLQEAVWRSQAGECRAIHALISNTTFAGECTPYFSFYLHKELANDVRVCQSWTIYPYTTEAELEQIFQEASEYINHQI